MIKNKTGKFLLVDQLEEEDQYLELLRSNQRYQNSQPGSNQLHFVTHQKASKFQYSLFSVETTTSVSDLLTKRNPTYFPVISSACIFFSGSSSYLTTFLSPETIDRGECPYCHKFFRTRLKQHVNAVHLKLRPYKCHFCEATFGQQGTRRNHEREIHLQPKLG